MTIEGFEVLLTKPEFSTPPRLAGRSPLDAFRAGGARAYGAWPGAQPLHSFTHRFRFKTIAERAAMEDFIDDRRGAWGAFWIPSWQPELEPLQTLDTGATSLAITKVNYKAVCLPDDDTKRLGRYVFLLNTAGQLHITKVLDATTGTPELLTFETAIPGGMTFQPGSYIVGFVYFVRLLTDRYALEFLGSPDASEMSLGMTQIIGTSAPTADAYDQTLRLEMPILTGVNGCAANGTASLTLPAVGAAGTRQVRVRGLMEGKSYTGGAADGAWYVGGSPQPGGQNVWKLRVQGGGLDNTYYLNSGLFSANVTAVDYIREIAVAGTPQLTLSCDSVDALEYNNAGGIVVPGIPPAPAAFNGQFVQIDLQA